MKNKSINGNRGFLKVAILAAMIIAAFTSLIRAGGIDSPITGSSGPSSGDDCPLTVPKTINVELAETPRDFCAPVEQGSMDIYSWMTFIAMNWPADVTTCEPDPKKSITDAQGPRVWETWLNDTEVFVGRGLMPVHWPCLTKDSAAERRGLLPKAVQELAKADPGAKILHFTSKAGPLNLPAINEAVGGPLPDQNGHFVRYEALMNKVEFDYIINNQLWSQTGQAAFSGPVDFPRSEYQLPDIRKGDIGSIEIKAAWKILSRAEKEGNRFYTRKAIVYDDDGANARYETVGLVGLHIIHKTRGQSQWIWTTFEQEDNAPTWGTTPLRPYSFNNPRCPLAKCPPNQLAGYDFLGKPLHKPVQVWRTTPIESQAGPLNASFKKLLRGSVWEHYRLIGTQWRGEFPATTKPAVLANAVLETYIQGFSSCNGCHGRARLAVCNGAPDCQTNPQQPRSADFSFMLGEAR